MNLQNQFPKIEQCKKIAEYGIDPTHANYFYYESIVNGETSYPIVPLLKFENGEYEPDEDIERALNGECRNEIYAAFTTSELLLMNGEQITLNEAQLNNSAIALADHLLGRLERGEITSEEINSVLYIS